MPEIDGIEIELEDLVLAVAAVDLVGEQRLRDLALEGLLICDERLLHILLGDRRSALSLLPLHCIDGQRAHDAERVDPVVFVEAAVLSRDHRLAKRERYLLQRTIGAVLLSEELVDDRTLRVIYNGGLVAALAGLGLRVGE